VKDQYIFLQSQLIAVMQALEAIRPILDEYYRKNPPKMPEQKVLGKAEDKKPPSP